MNAAAQDTRVSDGLLSRLHMLTVEQYEAMIRQGVFTEDDQVEFLDGWIVDKMTKGDQHVLVSLLLVAVLPKLLPEGYVLSSENPARIGNSLPEPDLCILRGTPRDYAGRRIQAADIALVLQIADTTLDSDRADKLRIYAAAGLPVYWIVNIPDGQIEVYTEPGIAPDGRHTYRQSTIYRDGDSVPLTLDGVPLTTIQARSVLP